MIGGESSLMSISFMIFVISMNLLIIYCMLKDISDYIDYQRNKREKEKNLLRENIHLDLTEEEYEMLNTLCRFDRCNTQEYLRKILKNL